MEAALEAGAEDVVDNDDGSMDVITDPGRLRGGQGRPDPKAGHDTRSRGDLQRHHLAAPDQDTAERLLKMVDVLEDLDDVQAVYTNADISDEIMAALDG